MKRNILKKHLLPLYNNDDEVLEDAFCNKWDEIEAAMEEYVKLCNKPDVSKASVCDACGCNKTLIQVKCAECGNTIQTLLQTLDTVYYGKI